MAPGEEFYIEIFDQTAYLNNEETLDEDQSSTSDGFRTEYVSQFPEASGNGDEQQNEFKSIMNPCAKVSSNAERVHL